ncbi:MAG: C40 family peptidase [Lachnospiraceae bacterium]|nr:C40 family peptidase [Lachnospiraceae bacterium]
MKKNIVRGSMLAVAALSLMLGGTSYTSSVKEQVSKTPAIISKAIENSAVDVKELAKGSAVKEVAQVTEQPEQPTEEETAPVVKETPVIETKEAKVESNQVVANIDSYLNIRSEASEDAAVVGKFYNGNVGTIVEKGDQWSLVSSGNAYGYVNNDYLLFGSAAEEYIANNCDQIAKVKAETLNVRAEDSTDSEVLSLSDEGDAFTILGQDNGWVKVAVTDEKVGYVASDYVYVDYVYETAVTIEEEEAALAAEAAAQEAENQAAEEASTQAPVTEAPSTQAPTTEAPTMQAPATEAPKKETVNSTDVVVKDESSSTETVKQDSASASGQAVADYAVQFVGNPYKYGGTSLTEGADCSGFVQSVYKHFGYSLSRTAASQANDGTKVSVKNLQPGDLLFYHGFGHVAIYIGGGEVVHASTAATGIKISNYDYSPIDKAVRIIN